MTLPGYKYLLTYRYAEIIHDLTVEFCRIFLSYLGSLKEKPQLPQNPEAAANFLLTLVHMETYLLSRQIYQAKSDFIQKGGFTENLFKQRLEHRKSV